MNRGQGICRANCAAWSAKTSRSTIPKRRWLAICGCLCVSGSRPATATPRGSVFWVGGWGVLVRERIAAGDSDAQVIDFLVERYGEFVLLKPRLNPHTLLLWLLPPLALAGGGLALCVHGRRRAKSAMAQDQLTAEEEARLEQLVAAEPSPDKPV